MAALRSLFYNRSGSTSLLGRTNFTDYRALMIMRWKVSCSGNVVGVWGHHLSYVWQSNADKHRFDTACIPRWIGVLRFPSVAAPNRRNCHDRQFICAVFRPLSDAGARGTAVCWFHLHLRYSKRLRFHREWTLLNIYCVHFNFGWATCAPERYVAKPAGVIMRHQYAAVPRWAMPHAGSYAHLPQLLTPDTTQSHL